MVSKRRNGMPRALPQDTVYHVLCLGARASWPALEAGEPPALPEERERLEMH